ncbi:hypothetical protein BRC83_00015 [Halobacteriales archaeon QS_1_68_17]|nr:MAG: hypothetical protein BRC83_00015 [Halobacteriales archaeon QS_1_68_17]
MPARPDYCPFCGARLADDADGLDRHLDDFEDCREQFAAWDGPPGGRDDCHSLPSKATGGGGPWSWSSSSPSSSCTRC